MNRFSIILPVRNGGNYFKACVQSILRQTVDDFNLIVLDNHSEDNTVEWAKSLNNEKIIIYTSDRSLTIEESWSRIKDIPKNEFITLIGHDDIMEENFLEQMGGLIDLFPFASLYLSHYNFIDKNGEILTPCKPLEDQYSPAGFTKEILELTIEPIGAIVRSSDYDKIGGMPTYPNLLFADYALWIKLASVSSVAVHPDRLFSYRIHPSTSKTTPASRYIDALFDFLGFLQNQSAKDSGLQSVILEGSSGFIRFYCQSLALRLLKTPVVKRSDKTVNSFVASCKEWSLKLSGKYSISRLTKLAILIDKYAITRNIYLILRGVLKR